MVNCRRTKFYHACSQLILAGILLWQIEEVEDRCYKPFLTADMRLDLALSGFAPTQITEMDKKYRTVWEKSDGSLYSLIDAYYCTLNCGVLRRSRLLLSVPHWAQVNSANELGQRAFLISRFTSKHFQEV